MERRVLRLLGDPAGAALAHRGQRDQELGRGSPLLPPPYSQRWLALAAVLLAIPPYNLSCAYSDPNYVRGGSSLQQLSVSFVLLLFMYLLGLLLGSIYQRFGRTGGFFFFGIVFLLLNVFVLLSSYWHWWETISGWLVQQTAAVLGLWLVPVLDIFALASYALLRKATV